MTNMTVLSNVIFKGCMKNGRRLAYHTASCKTCLENLIPKQFIASKEIYNIASNVAYNY